MEELLRLIGKSDTFDSYEAVLDYNAAGGSASNGPAERAVPTIADQFRTLKSALESRIDTRVPSDNPVLRRLVEHTASLLNRFKVHSDGNTAHQPLHGKRSSEKVDEFGEKIFFSAPKRLRSKLCRCRRIGTYLGVANSSNEHCRRLSWQCDHVPIDWTSRRE